MEEKNFVAQPLVGMCPKVTKFSSKFRDSVDRPVDSVDFNIIDRVEVDFVASV